MPKLGYSFEISDWNPCSVTCGGGSQDRTVSGQKKRPIPVMEILEDALNPRCFRCFGSSTSFTFFFSFRCFVKAAMVSVTVTTVAPLVMLQNAPGFVALRFAPVRCAWGFGGWGVDDTQPEAVPHLELHHEPPAVF